MLHQDTLHCWRSPLVAAPPVNKPLGLLGKECILPFKPHAPPFFTVDQDTIPVTVLCNPTELLCSNSSACTKTAVLRQHCVSMNKVAKDLEQPAACLDGIGRRCFGGRVKIFALFRASA